MAYRGDGLTCICRRGWFFGHGTVGNGGIKLSKAFQWPVGYATGVVSTPDGKYVVPLTPVGRVQLYDAQWRFLRGWHVDALAGNFKVECTPNGTIDVFSARGSHQYSFTQDGKLLSIRNLPPDFDFFSRRIGSVSTVVPTSPFLWVFSNPFLLWGVAAIGMIGLWRIGPSRQRPIRAEASTRTPASAVH